MIALPIANYQLSIADRLHCGGDGSACLGNRQSAITNRQ
jgi:hypothetical protein